MHAIADNAAPDFDAASLTARFQRVRQQTVALVGPLSAEDTVVQSMPDASPAKWHLAHTTWFFERFVLSEYAPGYQAFNPRFDYLFNSYYVTVGDMHARASRGLLSRPTLSEVLAYRRHVDAAMTELLEAQGDDGDVAMRTLLGTHHEQQHQELLLTDIKHLFSCNPLRPAYLTTKPAGASASPPMGYIEGTPGLIDIGHVGPGFSFDNERPRHRSLLHPHAVADRLVTNAEYREFIDNGGYRDPALWLADGWAHIHQHAWDRPMYWDEDLESEFTLSGMRDIDPHAAVCHVSYFEANAFARWAGARLPREDEWEALAAKQRIAGNFLEAGRLHPGAAAAEAFGAPRQMFGDVWEWTSSAYVGYPGFRPLAGSLGEYNGKFMNAQWVLRGGSCATPTDHIRVSYRNFFHAADRWQFMGIRLGRDL